MNGPDFLPPILDLPSDPDELLRVLYQVFERDYKLRQTVHRGVPVSYNKTILFDGRGKEEGFWHMVSRSDRTTGERLYDYRRAERLPWASPMMESPGRAEITIFDYIEGPLIKGKRRYIWLHEHGYVVILHEKQRSYFWVTAFFVDTKWKYEDLRRRYQQRA